MRQLFDLLVPDIGDFQNVPVIELLVQVGDALTRDTSVVTLESDKASLEVPAEVEGVVDEIVVCEGQKVSEGSLLLRYRRVMSDEHCQDDLQDHHVEKKALPAEFPQDSSKDVAVVEGEVKMSQTGGALMVAAAPSVRRLARELGVKIQEVAGSGTKGRLRKEDLLAHVKGIMQSGGKGQATEREVYEESIDFSVFGPVETHALSRIQKISGTQLARNWAAIPHVTSFDEADITEVESFRRQLNAEQSVKLTLLAFLIKAVQCTLHLFPRLNSSLQQEQLIIKKYYHIGFAVDTPNGLLVPVVRDVNRKGVMQISREIKELAERARQGKLKAEQMQGGSFTISSIGSIGGTHFTPIINAPEVAILGLGRAAMRPLWNGEEFVPRTILPVSLSWDHRAIDGVVAARFNAELCRIVADFRRVVL